MSETAPITQRDVEHVAALAALALTPEEVERMGRDLGAILGYVADLQGLDTSGVAPLTHVFELFAAAAPGSARADQPLPSLPRGAVMETAPATDGIFFKVPKVIER